MYFNQLAYRDRKKADFVLKIFFFFFFPKDSSHLEVVTSGWMLSVM